MFTQILRDHFGVVITLLLTVGFQDYYRPNDRGGVGASGKIGRGTGPGEHFVAITPPGQPAPAWLYAAPVAVARPEPAAPDIAPPASPSPRATTLAERTIRLPALSHAIPYSPYHRGWFNGYWSARLPDPSWRPTPGPGSPDASPERGPSPLLGVGLGWGLPAWLSGPMVYSWGYEPYRNPFRRGQPSGGPDRRAFDDYSWPIDVMNPPPTDLILDEAIARFEAAREAFRREDFARGLRLTDDALKLVPDDPMLQQFRALELFALRRYDEAAAALHSVLAVVPGWDWATVVSLYGDRDTYTRQLRLLEEEVEKNPRASAPRFVLAANYLTNGYVREAIEEWAGVQEQHPDDVVTAGLLRALRPSRPGAESVASPPPPSTDSEPAPARDRDRDSFVGTWIARPRLETTITMIFMPRGHVTWKVSQPGRDREFKGYAVYARKVLTISENEDNALVGTVRWHDDGRFTFKTLAARPADPGLTFAKAP